MFGLWRYSLAMLVVCSHIWGKIDGHLNWVGLYSVFAFYALSGYLMTLVLQERYGFSQRGFASYLGNRLLRIYPAYWAALIVAIALASWRPQATFATSVFFHLPIEAKTWAKNVFLFGLNFHDTDVARSEATRLIPPAWTLSIELVYYLAMGAFLSRSRGIVAGWVGASALYVVFSVAAGWSSFFRLSTIAAASLPFSLGAAVHFIPAWPMPRWMLAAVATLFAANMALAGWLWADPIFAGLYVSLALAALLLHGLRSWSPRSSRIRALDRVAGDLAYPIFLVHCAAMAVVAIAAFDGHPPAPATFFLWSLIPIHLFAAALHHGVVARLEPLRDRIRSLRR